MDHGAFEGFSLHTLSFLAGLADNNRRDWFEAHKEEYLTRVRGPMLRLVAALAPGMLAIDPAFDLGPRGPAVSRIHRDTRFSRDKSPYRVRQWIALRRRADDWTRRPAYFMEIHLDGYRYGMGYHAASPATMKALRNRIAARTPPFAKAMAEARRAGFDTEGEPYRRPAAAPADLPAGLRPWFLNKSAYLVRNCAVGPAFFSSALATDLERDFHALAPLYRLLAETVPG